MPVKKRVNEEVIMIDISPGNPIRYKWDFGDGSTPIETAEKIVKHTYTEPGTYGVIHSVWDACGVQQVCVDTAEITAAGGGFPLVAMGLIGVCLLGVVVYQGGTK